MARKKKTPLLLLLVVLEVCSVRMDICQSQADKKNLSCYTDYIHNITCAWRSADESDRTDAACTLHAKRVTVKANRAYSASCHMEPADGSSRKLRKCTLNFKKPGIFQTSHNLSISLSCDPGKHILTVFFEPACHIKLNPPGQPEVNFTAVSWFPQTEKHGRVTYFTSQLQWKRHDQSWSDPAVHNRQTKTTACKWDCEAQLDSDALVRGRTYEARVRVQADEKKWAVSSWSDWSPTALWVSTVGTAEPAASTQQPDFGRSMLGMIIAGAVLALVLAVILFKNDKATWVYEKIRGQPPPDPGKSFLKDLDFQNWSSPHFTSESLHSSLKAEDVVYVEVISAVDTVTLCSKEAALLDKMRNDSSCESTSSSFSNPIYSQLCPSPVTTATVKSLEPCDTDACSASTGCQGKGKCAENKTEEDRIKEMQMIQLLSKGNNNNNGEQVQVVSDYEKVEKLQVERVRLQSLDSGVGSGEEVSQESLDSHDEAPENREEAKEWENEKEVIFQKLFGDDRGCVVGKGSIQVCSDYEQVHKLLPSSPELPSLDSGVSSGGEEQVSHEESVEDVDASTESTHFLFPPPAPCALPCFPPLPLRFSGTDLSPALLSASRLVEPSGDGYMPVRQESG